MDVTGSCGASCNTGGGECLTGGDDLNLLAFREAIAQSLSALTEGEDRVPGCLTVFITDGERETRDECVRARGAKR